MALDDMGDETDGLMAEWSIGNKQSQVNGDLFQFSGNRRGEFVFDLAMAADTAHKRNVNGDKLPRFALQRDLPKRPWEKRFQDSGVAPDQCASGDRLQSRFPWNRTE